MINLLAEEIIWINRAVARSLIILEKYEVDNKKVKLLRSIKTFAEDEMAELLDGKVLNGSLQLNRQQAELLREMATASIDAIQDNIVPEYEKRRAQGFDVDAYISASWNRKALLEKLIKKLQKVR